MHERKEKERKYVYMTNFTAINKKVAAKKRALCLPI
jgi:hypothetical protein